MYPVKANKYASLYFFGKFSLYTIKLQKGCVLEHNKANTKKDYFVIQTKNPHR
jgi:hypothetical protein